MKIAICLDYNSFTEKVLSSLHSWAEQIKQPEITVIHIIDESIFYGTSSFEEELIDDLREDSNRLKDLCHLYLGKDIKYVEQYGLPRVEIDNILEQLDYDLLVIGTHARKALGARLMGSLAEHLLHRSKKPVLIIPD